MDNRKCCELFEMKILFKAFFQTLWSILTGLIKPVGLLLFVWFFFSSFISIFVFAAYMDGMLATHPPGDSVIILNTFACVGVWIVIGCYAFCHNMKNKVKEFRCEEEHKMYHVLGKECPCGRNK